MKVTFLTGEYPPMQGGIADYTAHLAAHLRHCQVQPSVLISQAYIAKSDSQLATQTDTVPVYPQLSDWDWRCWPQIKQFIERQRPDVLHIQYQAAAFDLGGWVNWLPWHLRNWPHRPKIVTTFHDLRIPYLFPKAGKLRWHSVLGLARYSDAVICTNPEDVLTLQKYDWATHVHEIPLGNNVAVNPPLDYDRSAWRAQLGLGEQALVLAYFGFLNESKGGEELIAALDRLVKWGEDAYLLMIGGDVGDSDPNNAAYAKRVRTLIDERKLKARIIFTGYVALPEVSAHLLAADMVVMPYRDGVSFRRTTLIAALRHGLPVISTQPAVVLPLIVSGENMLLISPQDPEAIATAVIRIARDKALHSKLAQGAEQLGSHFDWTQIAAKTVQVYEG